MIPVDTLKGSLRDYKGNNFTKYLTSIFGAKVASDAIARYYIGTSRHWPGSTVFWQVDASGKIRAGKIILYNPTTGKRVKEPYSHITWVHSALNLPDFNLNQCFFGEHLLIKEPCKPVALVESEKTAIIASIYLPEFVWLACGSLTNLKAERCKVLAGRNVVLYPDLNGFAKWTDKAKAISGITRTKVSDLLERNITDTEERKTGLDLADYLLKYKPEDFHPHPVEPVNIFINNILYAPVETITSSDFDNMRLLFIKTLDGKAYDLLFDKEGNPVSHQTESVSRLADFFDKNFKLGLLDNEPCLINNLLNYQ